MGLYMSKGKQARAEWQRILEAHGYSCYYCGRGDVPMIREHMFPQRRGGGNELENIVPACGTCNTQKGARTPLEWFLGRGEPKGPKRVCRLPQRGERPRRGLPARYNPPDPDAILTSPCPVCGCVWLLQGIPEWVEAFCADCKTKLVDVELPPKGGAA